MSSYVNAVLKSGSGSESAETINSRFSSSDRPFFPPERVSSTSSALISLSSSTGIFSKGSERTGTFFRISGSSRYTIFVLPITSSSETGDAVSLTAEFSWMCFPTGTISSDVVCVSGFRRASFFFFRYFLWSFHDLTRTIRSQRTTPSHKPYILLPKTNTHKWLSMMVTHIVLTIKYKIVTIVLTIIWCYSHYTISVTDTFNVIFMNMFPNYSLYKGWLLIWLL